MNKESLELWSQFASFAFEAYMKNGIEAQIFDQIGKNSKQAENFCRYSAQSPDYLERKVAASLAGFITKPSPNLLSYLLKLETDRDRKLSNDDFKRLDCQSVVEDIVFSAARWCKNDCNKNEAITVLQKVVQNSIDGQFWNTSSYAMVYLCLYDYQNSHELLNKFYEYSKGTPPKHPSNPDLSQERNYSYKLINGDTEIIKTFEMHILEPKDVKDIPELTGTQDKIVKKLLSVIERISKSNT